MSDSTDKKIPILTPDTPSDGDECEDWTLNGHGVWITVDSISVRVFRTDEGVVVDLYPNGVEAGDILASTYAFFDEAQDAIDEEAAADAEETAKEEAQL